MTTRRTGSRASLILGAMLACLLLTSILAWQAFDAAASHRAIAEGVLRDYATLAADEYIRRTTSQLGAYGYFPLLRSLGTWVHENGSLPTEEQLSAALPERVRRASELVRSLFAVPLAAPAESSFVGGDPAIESWVRRRMSEIGGEAPELGNGVPVLHETAGGVERTLVYGRLTAPRQIVVGFEVDRAALESWFAEAFERAPLLPPSLTGEGGAAASIFIRVTDGAGGEIFRSGESPQNYLASYRPYGDTYGGIFDGADVVASVDPAAAELLVIGGLPRTRLPLLFGLILLTLVLFVVTIVLLRRERLLTQLRSEFVSRVSHELRTPLTQIRMFAETLLLGRVRSESERRRSLEIIDRESRRLTHLVENVLQFSRDERGTTKLAPLPRELAPLIRELVREFRPLIDGDRVRLVTRLEDAVVPLDEDAFRQVLLNLLDNAVKYGPPHQEVAVESRELDGAVHVSVTDEGPGVPAADRERIWRRFHRLDREQESSRAGTGIGLAVVRELVQLHGGRTWVETAAGGGARFVVELPTAAAPGEER
jgi:signal transduction histidine kinase